MQLCGWIILDHGSQLRVPRELIASCGRRCAAKLVLVLKFHSDLFFGYGFATSLQHAICRIGYLKLRSEPVKTTPLNGLGTIITI